ncbi:MAG: hypothetical protein ACHP93_05215 [Solirubrobacterales bacterium]
MTRPSIALLAPTLITLAGCGPPTSAGLATTRTLMPATRHAQCLERRGLPDKRCTPGAVRAGVSLTAVCAYGYSSSVRPPEGYTEPLKFRQMRAYGLSGSPRDYEEDHLVPLSIGGAPRDPANLWPEPRHGPNGSEKKDELETWAARMACSRRIPLARLQREIANDRIAVYRATGGSRLLSAYPPGG